MSLPIAPRLSHANIRAILNAKVVTLADQLLHELLQDVLEYRYASGSHRVTAPLEMLRVVKQEAAEQLEEAEQEATRQLEEAEQDLLKAEQEAEKLRAKQKAEAFGSVGSVGSVSAQTNEILAGILG